jgi:hypothetical protein
VVLKALSRPERFTDYRDRDFIDENLVKAEPLGWELGGKKRAEKQFRKYGLDPEKAMQVVEHLRSNIFYNEHIKKQRFGKTVKEYFNERSYQYKEEDFHLIQDLTNLCDDPVHVLEEMDSIVYNHQIGDQHLQLYYKYAKSLADNPKALEIIAQLKKLKHPPHLRIAALVIKTEPRTGEKLYFFHHDKDKQVPDLIQTLSKLDDKTYQKLISAENLQRAQEIWVKLYDDKYKSMDFDFLYGLLKLASNPDLELAFFERLKAWFHNMPETGQKFNRIVEEIEALHELFPEIWALHESGFDCHEHFDYTVIEKKSSQSISEILNILPHTFLLKSVDEIIAKKEKFLTIASKEQLLQSVAVFEKFGLRIPLDFSDEGFLEFLLNSSPDQTLKTLTLMTADTTYLNKVDESPYQLKRDFQEFWRITNDHLATFSADEVMEAFAPLKEVPTANFRLLMHLVFINLNSIEQLRERIAAITNPEIRSLIEDQEFLDKISYYDYRGSFPREIWSYILSNPSLYVDLYRNKEAVSRKLDFLKEKKFDLLGIQYPDGLKLILEMSEEEVSQVSQALLAEGNQFSATLTLENLKKARMLIKLDQSAIEGIRQDFQAVSPDFNSFYYSDTSRSEIKAKDLAMYLSLEPLQRKELLNFLDKLNKECGYQWALEKYDYGFGILQDLSFIKKLSDNQTYRQKFDQFIAKETNDFEVNQRVHKFKIVTDFLEKNQTQNIDAYIENGALTAQFIYDFYKDKIEDYNTRADFGNSSLFDQETLMNMDEHERAFWQFLYETPIYLTPVLIRNKDHYDSLADDTESAKDWLKNLISSAKEAEENSRSTRDWKTLTTTTLSFEEKQALKQKILEMVSRKNIVSHNFYTVCSVLRYDFEENDQLIEAFKPTFREAFGFDLTADFIKKYDRFFQESQGENYAEIIPDNIAYWKQNIDLFAKLEIIGWSINDFERFRSISQNIQMRTTIKLLKTEAIANLSEKIGLNPNNLFYTDLGSLEYIAENINTADQLAFFKKILNEKPTSFRSTVSSFVNLGTTTLDQVISQPVYTERFFSAIEEFANVTPSLISTYILNPSENARAEYQEKIRQFQRDIHRNVPIMSLMNGAGGIDFLTDMIALTYPGTNVENIKNYLWQLKDRCNDVANLSIREDGYQGQIMSREKIVELKNANQPIDEEVIDLIKEITINYQGENHPYPEDNSKLAFQGWARLLVESGSTNQKVFFKQHLPEVLACTRISIGTKIDNLAEKMLGDTSQITAKNDVLSKAKEIFGIYYKDNASQVITAFLADHQEETNTLLARLSDKRLNALEKNIANSKKISEENRADFKEILKGLRNQELPDSERRQLLARLLAFLTERSIFADSAGLRKKVSKEADKIVLRDKEGQEIDPNLFITGYVTKNAASFFAKDTAGVCTAGNKELFNRSDHFHVNLVNREGIVVGNIQAYQLRRDGQPALIFRGFNPSTSLVNSANAEVLCDQMLDMVKQIAEDNNIKQVFIPQQDGWHPLTNRTGEGVEKYFISRFCRPENKVQFSFKISGGKTVNTFYRII